MIAWIWPHCVLLMLVLVPDTPIVAKFVGLALVANAMLNPVQVPEVDQLNVCGKLTDAPADGLLSVAEHAAFAVVPAAAMTRAQRSAENMRCCRRTIGVFRPVLRS